MTALGMAPKTKRDSFPHAWGLLDLGGRYASSFKEFI